MTYEELQCIVSELKSIQRVKCNVAWHNARPNDTLQSNVCAIKSVKLDDDATAAAMCKGGMTPDKRDRYLIIVI